MAISTPTPTQINLVSTALEYKSKKPFINIGASPGSSMTQAFTLVYDDIIRFQKGTEGYFTDAEIADFTYDNFAGNGIWFMDELTGIESDWDRFAAAAATSGDDRQTAYGYMQFTSPTVKTAVNRYINHIERCNARKNTRGWGPWGIPNGGEINIPYWISRIKTSLDNNTYNHKFELGRLTYDQSAALAFVHMHREGSKDSNFRLLSFGDITAAKELYKNNHHTDPDAPTLLRLNVTIQPGLTKDGKTVAGTQPGFFRIHYIPAPGLITRTVQVMPTAAALTLLYDIAIDQIFTDRYKAKVAEVRAANGLTSDD